jgi:DNA-binding transcriptional regulator YiaG
MKEAREKEQLLIEQGIGYTGSLDFSASRIKLIRVLLSMSQRQFAEEFGFTENSVARWEAGTSKPLAAKSINGLIRAAVRAGA